ncbi:hypothetical protein F5Y16DRAFT_401558 [Xylariaceae sp. FL0255]|nr:hypothetical protein F5Y16DRAFT_401558 [Xylariaceae sp. FL0255]
MVSVLDNNEDLLRYLYADLTRISTVSSPDIILHRFDDSSSLVRGVVAVQEWEEGLIASTGGSMKMDVESVTANAHFGTVMGMIRAKGIRPGHKDLSVPFCGLWRFVDGKAVEHWETIAGDPGTIAKWVKELDNGSEA